MYLARRMQKTIRIMTKPPFQSLAQELDALIERTEFYAAKATALLASRKNRDRTVEIIRYQKLSRQGTQIVTCLLSNEIRRHI